MLSRVTFKDLINLYGIWPREARASAIVYGMSASRRGVLCATLYLRLFCHPKLPKIMAKSCTLNAKEYAEGEKETERHKHCGTEAYVHDFDFICDLIAGEVSMCNSTQKPNPYGFAMAYLRSFYLSMKYWKKYQVLFFVKHHLLEVHESFVEMHKLMMRNKEIPWILDINVLLQSSLRRIAKKARKLRCAEIADCEILGLLRDYLKQRHEKPMCKIHFAKEMKSIVYCASDKCHKQQKAVDMPFKVCAACKMTYYCSKHCQKVSWKADHKAVCSNLRKFYNL